MDVEVPHAVDQIVISILPTICDETAVVRDSHGRMAIDAARTTFVQTDSLYTSKGSCKQHIRYDVHCLVNIQVHKVIGDQHLQDT